MAIGPRLDLRQSQSLVMTPQLQQAIRLLALSNLEVTAFLAEEIERNPLLETDDDGGVLPGGPTVNGDIAGDLANDAAGHGAAVGAAGAPGEAIDSTVGDDRGDGGADLDTGQAEELGWTADNGALRISDGGSSGAGEAGDALDFDRFSAAAPNLRDHLTAQLGAAHSGALLFLSQQIVESLDEAGYLTVNIDELGDRLGVSRAAMAAALAAVQALDPTGVGARNLAECLTLQLIERDRFDPCMAALVANLDQLARGALPQLRRICGVDEDDLREMIAEIRALDPKPGCRIGGETAPPIIPDLFVSARGHGWHVEINPATLPRLLVNRHYHATLASQLTRTKGSDVKAALGWLNECMAEASWLVKALDQRQRTIMKVATELVVQQEGFFRKGVAGLRPLTLARVADAIGMHESTVSRVTSNKYLACARGTFELKYFFTSGIASSAGGDAASAEAIKARIKALIDHEPAGAILSDDALVDLLGAEGHGIARRTVAKYREAIGLGSSVQRRRARALVG